LRAAFVESGRKLYTLNEANERVFALCMQARACLPYRFSTLCTLGTTIANWMRGPNASPVINRRASPSAVLMAALLRVLPVSDGAGAILGVRRVRSVGELPGVAHLVCFAASRVRFV